MKNSRLNIFFTVIGITAILATICLAETNYPTAIFPFAERGVEQAGLGASAGEILFASLAADSDLFLIERAEMAKILQEHDLNLSGLTDPQQSLQAGQIIGARLLITGSVIESGDSRFLVAKVIGTETSRVVGYSIQGTRYQDFTKMVQQLANGVKAKIEKNIQSLVPAQPGKKDLISQMASQLGNAARPNLFVRIQEEHIGQPVIDPAAETEFIIMCKQLGFDVLNSEKGNPGQADIIVKGEGFSEFAYRYKNLVGVKARLEIKAVERVSNKIIAIGRETVVEVDLAEHIAAKRALQKAALIIAEKMIPTFVNR